MGLSKYESSVKSVNSPVEAVYNTLSDLNNIERIKDRIPADKVKDIKFDRDSCSLCVDPVGEVKFIICDREENRTVKYTAENSPLPVYIWIQMLPTTETTSKIKVTCHLELNMFLRGMIGGKIKEGIEKIAETLAAINY
ncbi:MAG: SRPBCC family protein [Muribaculaceae bacterium]|nr:SRPBCC family protein [Bacteroidales bacterium]MBR5240444.1 SRPBCC family protein [Muribaculaceae bacterium]MBR5532720.1 SRPBCC family protein [Bacteroidales bacterium]